MTEDGMEAMNDNNRFAPRPTRFDVSAVLVVYGTIILALAGLVMVMR